MKFSIFQEMQISHPTRETEQQTFRDCVAQAVLADELGYHCVWEVEHHGLYEYSHSSAPEIFLSFVAARTKRIRLGHGVTLTPYRYNLAFGLLRGLPPWISFLKGGSIGGRVRVRAEWSRMPLKATSPYFMTNGSKLCV